MWGEHHGASILPLPHAAILFCLLQNFRIYKAIGNMAGRKKRVKISFAFARSMSAWLCLVFRFSRFYFADEKLVFTCTQHRSMLCEWVEAVCSGCLHIVCILLALAQSRVPFLFASEDTRTANICAIKAFSYWPTSTRTNSPISLISNLLVVPPGTTHYSKVECNYSGLDGIPQISGAKN